MTLNFNNINIGGNNSGGGGGTSNHAQLNNLDYANSGHTGFLDGNAADLTTTGKSTVAGYAMPGGTREVLAFPENDANLRAKKSFTATESGYYTVSGFVGGTTSSIGYCYIGNTTTNAIANQVTAPGSSGINTFLPVYKGQTVLISTYNITDESKVVSFVALKGDETVNNS